MMAVLVVFAAEVVAAGVASVALMATVAAGAAAGFAGALVVARAGTAVVLGFSAGVAWVVLVSTGVSGAVVAMGAWVVATGSGLNTHLLENIIRFETYIRLCNCTTAQC
jgi:hypothetical protein